MNKFYPLKVSSLQSITDEAVVISFNISNENKELFAYNSGQYITIKTQINGEEIRRPYSICSAPEEENLSIGVKKVQNGKMSTFLCSELKQGDVLQVMPPTGTFILSSNSQKHIGICAGSGITPIMSMIKSVIDQQIESSFTLIYGNRTPASTMFYKDLCDINNDNSNKVKIHWVFSGEKINGAINGRITKDNLQLLMNMDPTIKQAEGYFLCGPGDMIDELNDLLLLNRIPKNNIYFERFTAAEKDKSINSQDEEINSNVNIILDGDEFEFELSSDGDTILDAAMDAGADVPFSCKGAVCCTCKAKIIEGKVSMEQNYSLSDSEVDEGYILTCQSHPQSENVIIDYDEI